MKFHLLGHQERHFGISENLTIVNFKQHWKKGLKGERTMGFEDSVLGMSLNPNILDSEQTRKRRPTTA